MAIIGAGMAGLSCARTLRQAGFYVEVFERDRIIGGRMATTRIGMLSFDHGAQYVTGRSSRFNAYVQELVAGGYLTQWTALTNVEATQITEANGWYVGTPGMSAIVRPLAESVCIQTGRNVHTIRREPRGWYVWFDDESAAGPFQGVVVAVPAQEARLLVGRIGNLADQISRARMMPCWSMMVRLDERKLPEQDVYSDMSEVIRWVSRNSSKPGRQVRGETLVVHASPTWSRLAEDAEPEAVAEELWGEVCHTLNLPPVRPSMLSAHLWRYGLVDATLGESYLFSHEHKVGVAGDWCRGRLAEHAFESGQGLGRAMADALV